MLRGLVDLFFTEIFVQILEFFLVDGSFSGDNIRDLNGLMSTLLRTGSSSLRYFFSISLVALSIAS